MRFLLKLAAALLALVLLALAGLAGALAYTRPCEEVTSSSGAEPAMLAYRYYCYGGPEVLQLERLARPEPGAGEVLVRVRAAGVNPLDWHYLRGTPYFMRLVSGIGAPSEPRLGVDFSGTIEAVGPGVTRFKPGDEVWGGGTGAYSEFLTLPADRNLVLKPPGISHAQAAAVPIAGLTALQALRDKGGLQAGQEVLINGASGGVGTFAVQLARAMGARVTGVCSGRNVDLVRSLGAQRVINYKQEDFTLGNRRYDLIIDMVGNHSLGALRQVLAPAGTLVMVGGQKGDWLGPMVQPLQAAALAPFIDQQLEMLMARFNLEDLQFLADMMATGELNPVIDRQFPLAGLPEAIRYSETGRARGKIIVTIPE